VVCVALLCQQPATATMDVPTTAREHGKMPAEFVRSTRQHWKIRERGKGRIAKSAYIGLRFGLRTISSSQIGVPVVQTKGRKRRVCSDRVGWLLGHILFCLPCFVKEPDSFLTCYLDHPSSFLPHSSHVTASRLPSTRPCLPLSLTRVDTSPSLIRCRRRWSLPLPNARRCQLLSPP
jgi:hypothetical protein